MGQSKEHTLQEELASKWLDKRITPAEEQEFANWYHKEQDQPLIISKDFAEDYEFHKSRIYEKVIDEIGLEQLPGYKKWLYPLAVAAAITIAIVAGYFYIQLNRHYDLIELANNFHTGSSVAVLINENGRERLLKDSVFNEKRDDGSVLNGFRKIVTPRGGHYKIVLEDGTKVWVNVDTKLVYPVTFGKADRTVKLYGEAYFDVIHDSKRPFRVQVVTQYNKQDITVMGTKFNVSGYDDDTEIRTRVYEGMVKVSSGKNHIVLSAGNTLSNKDGKLLTRVLELEKNLARPYDFTDCITVEGDFFASMRKVARLYNVSVVYDGTIKGNKEMHGCIGKKTKLEDVLTLMEAVGPYQFSIEKNKVIVSAHDYE